MNIIPFEIPCVILSGGKSSRMGEDKSLLPFGSSNSLIEYQYKRLKPYFKNLYISSKIDKFDIVSKVGQANYSAAFGNSTDAESQAFGTLIRIMKSIDMNEAMQISSFVMQNQAGFAAQDPTVLNNYLNLMGNIYSTPANPQLIPDTLIHTSLVNSFAQMIQVVGSGQSVDWNGVFAGFSGF